MNVNGICRDPPRVPTETWPIPPREVVYLILQFWLAVFSKNLNRRVSRDRIASPPPILRIKYRPHPMPDTDGCEAPPRRALHLPKTRQHEHPRGS